MDRQHWYPAAGTYLRAWLKGKEITANGGTVRLFWNTRDLNAEEFRAEMRQALDRRINAKGSIDGRGRKWTADYQRALWLDAREIHQFITTRTYPAQYHWRTPEMRARFDYLLVRDW